MDATPKLTKEDKNALVSKFFEENNFVQSNIESFNDFIGWRLQKLVDELGEATPSVIPPEAEEVKIVFGKVRIEKPSVMEADGTKWKILPVEARVRNLTYAAPVFLEVALVIDGKERERAEVQICDLPIMLKSKYCYLHGLNKDELIVAGEDPYDAGGYFIINGTERTLVLLEDLAANTIFTKKEKSGPITHVASVYSASDLYKMPHTLERTKEGLYQLTFGTNKRMPLVSILKALGLVKDADIAAEIGGEDNDVYINLVEYVDQRTEEAAQDFIGKELGIMMPKEQRVDRVQNILDNFLLPHVGFSPDRRLHKARYLCRLAKKLLLLKQGKVKKDDKDHYQNKRVRMSGDLLEDLFRQNLRTLVNDMLYIFQRSVRRGKILPLTLIVRTKFLSDRIKSALATGNWTGSRQGLSQRLDRENALATLSHLQRIVSLLEAQRESFDARMLHSTHWGRLCALESPEGKHMGLRKNLALMAMVTPELGGAEIKANLTALTSLGLKLYEAENGAQGDAKLSDVFFNGQLVGTVADTQAFVAAIVAARREGKLSRHLNVQYKKVLDTVYVALERDRVVRPLIIVKGGAPLLTPEHAQKLREGTIKWSDLVKEGVIEFLDCSEEENSHIALDENHITPRHTHMEINPIAIFGITTALVPYANYNQSSKLNRGQKTQKQAMGCYTLSYPNRLDTAINLLHYPQTPMVRSFAQRLLGDERAAGQNVVIAVINYDGYNMSDALVFNEGSIQRGLGRSTYFRPYSTEKLRYPGGQTDDILIPNKDVQGYTVERDYRLLTEEGITFPEAEAKGGDVLIGKTSPPRFLGKLESFSSAANIRKDTSIRVRYGETGVVNKVIITEGEGGAMLIRVDIRETRIPEVGDKYSSRHGQKGVIGQIVPEENIPFTASGIRPDILFSPNGLPKRMTVAQMIEVLGGKVGGLAGRHIDGTSFLNEPIADLRQQLLSLGFRDDGTEVLFDGRTGKQVPARIFIGNIYYLRLKHQVADKIQSRTRGPVALLTRQPTEGKAKEGGLRLGEMEKETFIAHGASLLLKERFDSDKTIVWVCERCGDIAVHDVYKNKAYCLCGEKTKVAPVEMAYAFKLFVDELKSLHIRPKLKLKEKY